MIVTLAGGVGGARLAAGLSALVGERLTVIVNTADDFEHLGLAISPDLDTVMYTLGGLENTAQGWGVRDETWTFMTALRRLGGETWFLLGDHDMATHVERTRLLAAGETLSAVTRRLCAALGVPAEVLPMCEMPVRTRVATHEGELAFQDYFVRRRCEPRLMGLRFAGAEAAVALPAALARLSSPRLEAIVIAPSNPYVSVAPILAVPGFTAALDARTVPCIAVSPIVGGKAIKGPAAKMMAELGLETSVVAIARHYAGRIDGLVIDEADRALAPQIERLGIRVLVCDAIMQDPEGRRRLAQDTLRLAHTLRQTAGWRPARPTA
jgi:LPPG:FO 2-phospho-L-lactate transferase